MKDEKKVSTIKFWCRDREHHTIIFSDGTEQVFNLNTDVFIKKVERVDNDTVFYLINGEQIVVNDKDLYEEMVIREYEYEINRPWNCQERFIIMQYYIDPWQEYKNRLLSMPPNSLSMINRMIKDTMREGNKGENALSFEFEINGGRFIHVAQDWTKQYSMEPITITIQGD